MRILFKKLLPFFIFLLVVISCAKNVQLEEREKVIDTLNKKFNLHDPLTKAATGLDYDCKFQFRMNSYEDKVLIARFCESTSERSKEQGLTEILTPENLALIKNSGFEKIILYNHDESKWYDRKDIQ